MKKHALTVAAAMLLTQLAMALAAVALDFEAIRAQCEKAAGKHTGQERERFLKRCIPRSAPLHMPQDSTTSYKSGKTPMKAAACNLRAQKQHLSGEAFRLFVDGCVKS